MGNHELQLTEMSYWQSGFSGLTRITRTSAKTNFICVTEKLKVRKFH
jgi:hypothetical protein